MVKMKRTYSGILLFVLLTVVFSAGYGYAQKVKEAVYKGETALGDKEYDAAAAVYQEALKFAPYHKEARKGFEEAQKARDSIQVAIDKGNIAMGNQDFARAITAFQEALSLAPDHAEAKECLEKAQKANNVKDYLNKAGRVALEKEKLSRQWNDLRSAYLCGQISDYQFGSQVLNYFLPETRRIGEQAKGLTLQPDDTLGDTHEEFVTAIHSEIQAFSEIVLAVGMEDYSKIAAANKALSEAGEAERKILGILQGRAGGYGVEQVEQKNPRL